jgi:hypothetical protein
MLEPNYNKTIDKVGALNINTQNTQRSNIWIGSQKLPMTYRGSNPCFSQKDTSEQDYLTESSTYSTEYSQKFLNLTSKIQKNNKEIKRIEGILYQKSTKKEHVSNKKNIQAFVEKAQALDQWKYG